jgi:hypothetical protein
MIGAIDSGVPEDLRLFTIEIANVNDQLRPFGHTFTEGVHDFYEPLEIEIVHGHEEKRVQLTGIHELAGFGENIVQGHHGRRKPRIPFGKTAKLAPSGTGVDLDPYLTEQDRFISETLPAD